LSTAMLFPFTTLFRSDRFDQAFGNFFEGLAYVPPEWFSQAIPEDWLRKEIEKNLSPEELAELKKRGSLEELLEEFRGCLFFSAQDRKSTRLNSSHASI